MMNCKFSLSFLSFWCLRWGWWIFSLFLVGLNFKAIKASVHRPFTRDTIVWWLTIYYRIFTPFLLDLSNFKDDAFGKSYRRMKVRGDTTLGATVMKAALCPSIVGVLLDTRNAINCQFYILPSSKNANSNNAIMMR